MRHVRSGSTFVLGLLFSLTAQAKEPNEESFSLGPGRVMVSGRLTFLPVVSPERVAAVTVFQPVVEGFVLEGLAIGGYASWSYIDFDGDINGDANGSITVSSLGVGLVLSVFPLTGAIRPMFSISVGYEHAFIEDESDSDQIAGSTILGVLFAANNNLVFTLGTGYRFQRMWWGDYKFSSHIVPFVMGIGYVF